MVNAVNDLNIFLYRKAKHLKVYYVTFKNNLKLKNINL